jgi:hypothetical protein
METLIGDKIMKNLTALIRWNYVNWLFVTFGEEVPPELPEFNVSVNSQGKLIVFTLDRNEHRLARLAKALEVWGANYEIRELRLLKAA